ncbi:MAG: YdiU family protein, partial [Pseudomonadota bacterium]
MFAFDNSYARLPERFYTRMPPTGVAGPSWIASNEGLAQEMGLDPEGLRDAVEVFAGNRVPDGAAPLAQLYAGHQFGGWSPQLGDGRAILLGEHVRGDRRWDVALKGSGPTPYSRMGDGRAAIGPVVREYLVSEAMHALGVPTTRALAAVTTGETVLREDGPLPGAVLTRVASSHIRVGTFQVFAARDDVEGLAALLDHALARHAPGADGPMGLLRHVMAVQARLVARWMGLGFVHGVMNTDNMSIAGETIDYGPCAFLEVYHPDTVFSSIDQFGRYAWKNQPDIALWNLAQLATALLPLMGER